MADGAWLVVRAVVADPADRPAFDRWYREEHLPDAMKAFSAQAGWRGWSETDASVHHACYRFDSLSRLRAIMRGPAIAALIEEFDRHWLGRVTRTREVIALADEIAGPR
jgi:hypothetical protein